MKNLLRNLSTRCNQVAFNTIEKMNKHKKMLSFAYMFALLTACVPSLLAFADQAPGKDAISEWLMVEAVLSPIYTVMIIVGILVTVIGIILLFIARFNEQSITGPLITIAVGAALILVRALVGPVINEIAFNQMYKTQGYTYDATKDAGYIK